MNVRERPMTRASQQAANAVPQPIQPRVLIAEDNELASKQLKTSLQNTLNVSVDLTADGKQALVALKKNYYSVFLTDLKMPLLDGMQLIREVQEQRIPVTVVVMTGHGSIDGAVQAMQAGAYDFFTKPLNLDRLKLVLSRILEERALRDEVAYLRNEVRERQAFADIITTSPRMLSILDLVGHIAQTTTTVLIEGETGTGKEMIARAIHRASAAHRSGPLVPVHCAALPETLLEDELFGHEKGAYTSADRQRKGRFEQAHGGTLFLDEIGEVPLAMQVKLLRVLQERQFERVGGSETLEVDVRVITASNKSLARMVRKGTFREDLFYRVNVVRIEVPPLRDRPEDIALLAEHFCRKYMRPGEPAKEVSPAAMELLLKYSWPGNVRELENVMERVCVTGTGTVIEAEQVAPDLTRAAPAREAFRIDLSRPLPELLNAVRQDVERRYIRKALTRTRGNVVRCAKICGLSRRSVTAKLAEYGIKREAVRKE